MDDLIRQKSPNWKVKVYLLNDTGNWDDCGTGTLDLVRVSKNKEETDYFQVARQDENPASHPSSVGIDRLSKLKSDNTNPKVILYLPISKNFQFDKQGDSIISWVDKNLTEEIAISFLDTSAANETWRAICMKIGKNPSESKKYLNEEVEQLVMPRYGTIEKIKNDFNEKKEWMLFAISKNLSFLDELQKFFQDCEDLADLNSLHEIYEIIRILVFSDDIPLLETLLSDKYYMMTFGALEYDPALGTGVKPKHREFLKNKCYYKKVIDFKEQTILKKIHENYRITYLRDSVIGTIIDDPVAHQYNTMIFYNNSEIFEHISSYPEYLDHIFENIQQNLKDSIGFLYELQTIVKNMFQVEPKVEYSSKLISRNVFVHITNSFNSLIYNAEDIEDPNTRNILKINLIEIMSFICQLKVNDFISFLISGQPESTLLAKCLSNMLENGDQGLQIQIAEIIKFLLEPAHEKKVEIQDFIYDYFFPEFHQHFNKFERNEIYYSFVQQYLEILIFCIKSHGYRIRHYIIQQKLIQDLIKVINEPEKTLSLAVIRLIKNIFLGKDEFLIKYLIQNNIFDPIFEVYLRNAHKDNLLKSAILELMNLPAKEHLKKLVLHLTDKYKERIIENKLEKYFSKLFTAYDKYTAEENPPSEKDVPLLSSETKSHPGLHPVPENVENYNNRELSSMEDEEYFENGEEEENKQDKKAEANGSEKIKNEPDPENKNARDFVLKIKNKIQSKKKEDDEEGFSFLNKLRIKSPSVTSEKGSIASISFDLNLSSPVSEQEDESIKRPSLTSLEDDEEIKNEIKAELQKKQKI